MGYELHIPTEHAAHVYEIITKHGKALGVGSGAGSGVGAGVDLVHAGLKALGSLRMEKGYRDYGHDMDNTDTLMEVGLGFTADMKKEGGFLGREEVVRQKKLLKEKGGLTQRLVQVGADVYVSEYVSVCVCMC